MSQPRQLADEANEVARRILTASYGNDIGEKSQLFTDLAEMIRRQIRGEKLFGEWNHRDQAVQPQPRRAA